jgi:hypothetical protein
MNTTNPAGPDRKPTQGVIYIAAGDKYVAEAIEAARSIREVMPSLPMTLFAHRVFESDLFESVQLIENPAYSWADKARNLQRTPYDRTAYIDCDTYVCRDITQLFDLLDHFDLLVAHDTERTKADQPDIPRAFPEMNCGFIVYEKTRAAAFLNAWLDAFEKDLQAEGKWAMDQRSFRAVLLRSRVRFYVLPPEFHCFLWEPAFVCGEVAVLHGRHHLPLKTLAEQANASTGPRIFKAGLGAHQLNLPSQLLTWAAAVTRERLMDAARNPWSLIERLRPGKNAKHRRQDDR